MAGGFRRLDIWTHDSGREGRVQTQAEIGGMCLQEHGNGSHQQELEKRHGTDCRSQPPEGTNPADALVLDFWPPELEGALFLLF